jgi:DNA repair protein RecN (Recombination protein N)
MLTHLQIRDFAIIDTLELEWPAGFTVLTGETGAGKSILIDALLLATGARADSGAVRAGAERAEVTASFDVTRNGAANEWLEEQSIEHDGECIVRRIVTTDGRGRAYVNGRTVPAQSLRALGERLVDIHGQLEFQSLVRRPEQRRLLDASGGLDELVDLVAEAHREWKELDRARAEFDTRMRDRDARIELLTHYVAELEALDPRPDEADALQTERRRYAALGRLAEGTAQVVQLIEAEDAGAMHALARAQSQIRALAGLDAGLGATAGALDEAVIACREATSALSHYIDGLDADPERQEWLEARLAALEAVARKHRVEPGELPELRARLGAELEELRTLSGTRADLDARLEKATEAYRQSAAALSAARHESALDLDRRVTELMQDLGMMGGVFATQVRPSDPAGFAAHGADEVEFLVSANPGQPPRPLARVASGGELSRISLALQVATLQAAHLPCLVFDEVDAGVGGAVAEHVGRLLARLAGGAQVLCVTHLPQVAAQAGHQLRVEKSSQGGRTRTTLEMLTAERRIEELARMLGGAKITERTREHAREMLEQGQTAQTRAPRRAATSRPLRDKGSSRARSDRARSASGR